MFLYNTCNLQACFFSAKGHIVLLLFSAGPLDIKMAENYKVSAILHCFFPAQATGSALYNVITMKTNDSNPAGRLPFTWYSSQAQVGYHFYIVSLPLPFHDRLVPHPGLMKYSLNVTLYIFRDHRLEIWNFMFYCPSVLPRSFIGGYPCPRIWMGGGGGVGWGLLFTNH